MIPSQTKSFSKGKPGSSKWKKHAIEALLVREELWRRKCREDFASFCVHALEPIQQFPARHHHLVISELQAVADGLTDRLMIFMPPGSAKSTYATKLFPAWLLNRHLPGTKGKRWNIITASYNSDLAEDFSGEAQQYARDNADIVQYRPTTPNRALWRTTEGGMVRAVGVNSGIAGRRADLVLIDDPARDRAEVDQVQHRDKAWQWYRSSIIPRLRPGARIVLITTRWHPDDMAGRLLEQGREMGRPWKVVELPALAFDPADFPDDDPPPPDPLGRKPGEALWPEYEDAAALQRKREEIGEIEFQCLFQQRPLVSAGLLFDVSKIPVLEAEPPVEAAVRGWDLAGTEQVGTRNPDWTVGLKLGRLKSGGLVVMDVVRMRGRPEDVDAAIVNTAGQDSYRIKISIPKDPGQAGIAQSQYLAKRLAGKSVVFTPESGSKATRAAGIASQINVGNVSIVRGAWNAAFLEELRYFPHGAKKDQVDALSRAYAMLDGSSTGIWGRIK